MSAETTLDLDVLAQTESVFALSNSHLGWRGNLDEGEPRGLPGSYLNGVYEQRPLPYAERGYGYPEDGQTIINVTDGKVIRLLVDDEPFDAAAFHIGADIAEAVDRYVTATGDQAFERDAGLELLTETARLWRSLGHHDVRGPVRIDGVTGPGEYSAIVDNNVYTTLMAQHNLRAAADAAGRHPDRARELGIEAAEAAG